MIRVSVATLAPGLAERIGLAVHRRVVLLDPAVVPATEQPAAAVEQRRADRDSALGEPEARLVDGDLEHPLVVDLLFHVLLYSAT